MENDIYDFHLNSQESLKKIINNKLSSRSVIFEGKKGIGKQIFLSELSGNILNNTYKVRKNIHPDLYQIKPENNKILVDDINDLDDWIYKPPYESSKKIILINNANAMNNTVQNKILKLLEEPPDYILFFLVLENSQMLLPTVRSRSIVFSLNSLPNRIINNYLSDDFNEEDKQIILSILDGSLRNIDFYSKSNFDKIFELSTLIIRKELDKIDDVNKIIDNLSSEFSINIVIEEMIIFLKNILSKNLIKSNLDNLNLLDGIYFIDSLCKIFEDSFDTNFNVKLAIDELVLNYFVTNRS